jgi:hypothetical protein
MLCGFTAVMQASGFECLVFDPFSFQQNGLASAEVDIRGLMGRPKFKLWGKIELEPDEQAVLDHYHFDKAVLIDSFQP